MINSVQLITHFLTIVLSCKGKGPGLRWPPKESEGDSWPPQPQTSHQWTKVLAVSGVLTFTVTSAHYSGRFTMLLTRLVTSASLTAPVVNRCHSLISRFLLSADHHTTTSASPWTRVTSLRSQTSSGSEQLHLYRGTVYHDCRFFQRV